MAPSESTVWYVERYEINKCFVRETNHSSTNLKILPKHFIFRRLNVAKRSSDEANNLVECSHLQFAISQKLQLFLRSYSNSEWVEFTPLSSSCLLSRSNSVHLPPTWSVPNPEEHRWVSASFCSWTPSKEVDLLLNVIRADPKRTHTFHPEGHCEGIVLIRREVVNVSKCPNVLIDLRGPTSLTEHHWVLEHHLKLVNYSHSLYNGTILYQKYHQRSKKNSANM